MTTTPYRIAFLTDIHANLHALEAVLHAIRQEQPDLILVGGDLTFKFPYPRETLDLLATVDHLAVSGNTDLYVTAWAEPGAWPHWLASNGAAHAQWTRQQIGEAWATKIAALPLQRELTIAGAEQGAGSLLLFHGIPDNVFLGIHPPPGPENLHPKWAVSEATLDRYLAGVTAPLILAGHTHIPMIRHWRQSVIVNPGAVAHTWPPTPGPELARFALLTYRPGQPWEIGLRQVPYDTAAAIQGIREIPAQNPLAAQLIERISPHGAQ